VATTEAGTPPSSPRTPATAIERTPSAETVRPPLAAGRIAYYHNDPSGCPLRLTEADGRLLWSASYSAWGAVQLIHASLATNPLRLQGQYEDSETGLYYNRHRYYAPRLGQFSGIDPLGLAPGENPYRFAKNALQWIDPLGLHSTKVPYGSTDLSEMAQIHRLDHGVTGGQNVAVFEYLDDNGMPNYISQASGDGLHAERRIAARLDQMGIDRNRVTRIYTELAPCPEVRGMQYCGRMLASDFPGAQVTHSFDYGVSKSSRKAGVRDLKAAVRKLFRGC
jgi:RHS repeat-associated protein